MKSSLSCDNKDGKYEGLYSVAVNPDETALLIVKYRARVHHNTEWKINDEEDLRFCVDTKLLLNHLKSINPACTLTMYRIQNDSRLYLKATSAIHNSGRRCRHVRIETIDKESDQFEVSDIDYEYMVSMDLTEFQRILRLAKNINSDHIRISILSSATTKSSVFVLQIQGEFSYDEEIFNSCIGENTSEEQKMTRLVIKTTENTPTTPIMDYKKVYEGEFMVSLVSQYVKCIDNHTINLHLTNHKPLILTCPVGTESSYIAFVLAPIEPENSCVTQEITIIKYN
jgi:hypothetical protein